MNEETGITISPGVNLAYFSQNLDVLNQQESILNNVMSTSKQGEMTVRTVLARSRFFRDDVYKPIHVLSGGERVKVAFAKIYVSDSNMLILDEPTNFLDVEAVEASEELLIDYEGALLIVSHDRVFVNNIANRVFSIEDKILIIFDGTYEHYKNHSTKPSIETNKRKLLVIENKMTEVLGKLSLEPTEELNQEFQELLRLKNKLLSD